MDLKVLWTIASSMGTYSDLEMLKKAEGFKIDFVTSDRVDKDSIGFAVTGKKYVIPKGSEPGYIESVADICRNERITTIVPQYSDELVPLSGNMELFDSMGVKVLVTEDTEMLSIANNKKRLYEHYKGRSFIPRHVYSNDIAVIEKALYSLGYPESPICIKPTDGEGGKGFRIITEEKSNILEEQGNSPNISWDLYKRELSQIGKLPELMVMEYLPGAEYSVDCVCRDGETIVCIPRERVETSMGAATISVIRNNRELIELTQEIVRDLKLSYNVNVQYKYSNSGRPMLVEINPRVSGALVANCGAGVNMMEIALKVAYGRNVGSINIDWDTKMIRYWDQIFISDKTKI